MGGFFCGFEGKYIMNREIERPIVAKFGGSSLADAGRIERVAEIVYANPNRRHIVVSAPGKRFSNDEKITDLLFRCSSLAKQGLPFDKAFETISQRYEDIGKGLRCHSSVVGWLHNVHEGIRQNEGKDWIASRGEWMMAQIFARFLGGSFVDAAKLIKFKKDGQIDPLSYDLIKYQLAAGSMYHVIPGFYGTSVSGKIQIFARGGSDITGAIIARGVNASVYENWTDVDGLLAADPRLVDNPKVIREITYREMRELGYRGADVLQRDAVLPVFEANIPIHIRNTFNPTSPGSFIRKERQLRREEGVIGIAGKSGFVAIQIEKFGMNEITGIGSKILDILRDSEVSFEQLPMGLDGISVILREAELNGKEEKLIQAIRLAIEPTNIGMIKNLGVVCLVGEGIRQKASSIDFSNALNSADINIQAVSYSMSGNNITIAIKGDEVQKAIKVLYDRFI